METVTVKSFDNYFSANIILTRLQEAGIRCFLVDETAATVYPVLLNAIGGIKLVVAVEDREQALTMLDEFEEEYLRAAECPRCHGDHIALISKPEPDSIIHSVLKWLFSSYAVPTEKIYQCQDCKYESKTLPGLEDEYPSI
jgi:hypothetical protein